MKKNHEIQSKKNKIKGEVGYGIMWLFVALLIEGIGYIYGFRGSYTHMVAGLAVIGAVYKFSTSIKLYRKFN